MKLEPAGDPAARRRKLTRRARTACAALASVAVLPLAIACESSGTASGTSAAGTVTIRVAAAPGPEDAPLYVAAKEGGLFSKAGLKVTIASYPSVNAELQALKKHQVDAAEGDYADFFYAAATSKKLGLHVVADGYHAAPGVMEVLAAPSSGITTPQGLAGKTVGVAEPQVLPVVPPTRGQPAQPYSLEMMATQSVLQSDGVNLANVRWVHLPAAHLVSALARHKVDAIVAQEPYVLEAEKSLGAIEVLDSCTGATDSLPLSGYFTVGSFAQEHPEALQDFRSALEQAQANAVLPGPVRAVVAHYPGMSMQNASMITIGVYPTSLSAANLQRVADLMFNAGVLVKAFDVASLMVH
jgi:NitT/TauT family transport system substrate-binding protein